MAYSMQSHSQGRESLTDEEEDLEDGCVGYYLSRVTGMITSCLPDRQEQPSAKRQKTGVKQSISGRSSKPLRKRKISIPVSRYNSSICNDQPPRRSQLLWLASRDGSSYPVPQVPRYQSRMVPMEQEQSDHPSYQNPESEMYGNGKGQMMPKKQRLPDPPRQSGVIGNPDALINRPKSAYTRGLKASDEEPVFWQHSHRAMSRFRQSQFSTHRPKRPLSSGQATPRRSNASDFEHLLDKTFAPSSVLNLQPNPIINIEAPRTSYLFPTPTEDSYPAQNMHLPPSPAPSLSSSRRSLSQKRFSGFRPLQLSFYLPGNRLSLLPHFNDEHGMNYDIPPVPGVARPPSALIVDKNNLKLDPPLTSYSIPRKAVASRVPSLIQESNRSSTKSSVTLIGRSSLGGSILEGGLSSENVSNHRSWCINRDTLTDVDMLKPSISRPASYCAIASVSHPSEIRVSAPSAQVETNSDRTRQTWHEYPTIYEESSPVSSTSSDSIVSCVSPLSTNDDSVPSYHEYEFSGASQPAGKPSKVDYYDYDFVGEARRVPILSKSNFQAKSLQVAPLFNSSVSSSEFSDEELAPPSKLRSSLGSSTLFHGESSPESDKPVVKTTLSIAFPSPTLQNRLSEWLSRSASQMPATTPKRGDCYGHPDSPTLGFSWKDFGFQAGEQILGGEDGVYQRRKRAFTGGSSTNTYIDGEGDAEVKKFPIPMSMGHSVNVGVAF